MPIDPLMSPSNTSRRSFLENLGLVSGASQRDAVKRFDSLNWDALINPTIFGKPANFAGPVMVREDVGEDPYFNSYSGSDVSIYLLFDDGDTNQGIRNFRPFREIQTLSVSSARSVHPVRRLGESHVTQYTRGARTIAGSMVCVSGDRDPFLKIAAKSVREKNSIAPFFTDEIPSFSILIMAGDEYGNISHAALSDLTITNFGQTFSSDDMYLENTYTYVARFYHPLLPDPSVLNKLPQNWGSQNKLSKPFQADYAEIKEWIKAETVGKLVDEQMGRLFNPMHGQPGFDNKFWAQAQDWIIRQNAVKQSAGNP